MPATIPAGDDCSCRASCVADEGRQEVHNSIIEIEQEDRHPQEGDDTERHPLPGDPRLFHAAQPYISWVLRHDGIKSLKDERGRKMTPAMAAGVASFPWSTSQIAGLLD